MWSSLLTGAPEINKVRVLVDPEPSGEDLVDPLIHDNPQKFSGPLVPLMVQKAVGYGPSGPLKLKIDCSHKNMKLSNIAGTDTL